MRLPSVQNKQFLQDVCRKMQGRGVGTVKARGQDPDTPNPTTHQQSLQSEARIYKTVQWFQGGLVFEVSETLVSLTLRLKNFLGPVTRVKKKQRRKSSRMASGEGGWGGIRQRFKRLGSRVHGSGFRVYGLGSKF